MDNADDAYVDGVDCAQCFACGQLFCGQCKPELEANVTNCPNCRAPLPFRVSVEKNVARLLELLKRTPGRHTPWAQSNLGVAYANGEGVQQDYVEAVQWYRLAADQGHAKAQCNLGGMYDQGRGVRQDYVEAVKWYRLGADQGNADAQYNLGAVYGNGKGLPQDLTKAARLFKLAADQGHANAIAALGMALHQILFPPGTKVKLVGLKAVALNGKRGVVVACSGAAAPALGRIAVELEGGGGTKAIPYEKLQLI
jgi:TPR repeat protein